MKIESYLKIMLNKGASDLYLKGESPAFLRIDGKLAPIDGGLLSQTDLKNVLDDVLTDEQRDVFKQQKELDGAYDLKGAGRFRYNIYLERGSLAMVFRSIKSKVLPFEDLNLPVKVIEYLASQPRGLVLITGYAGSGKSTTIAAMLDYINDNFNKHIISIEDPIEFLHEDKKSIFSQREIGYDTLSFPNALRHVIRQSPDVIFIGEMRDANTMEAAIMAAETGHLVVSTLHTIDTTQTVDRIINFFPAETHNQIRMQLALLLRGVVSMRLVPRSDGPGRVPACEILLSTPTVRKYITDAKTAQLVKVIEEGRLFGMQSFNQSILEWLNKGAIDKESALHYASNADELELMLKDILPGKDRKA